MARILVAVVVVLTMAAVLAVNAMLVDLQTRPAMARSGGTLMDRSVFTGIAVIATDQIEFTYALTITAGG